MKRVLRIALAIGTVIACAIPANVAAQEATNLESAIVQFNEGEGEESARGLHTLLESERLSIPERTTARKYLAWIHILGQGEDGEEQAVKVFKDLVSEDASFGMDDLSIEEGDPPALLVRSAGRAVMEVRHEELMRREARLATTSRNQAFLRSAIIPGWGQRYSGYRGRSFAMLGITAGAVVYAISADNSFRTARDDYEGAAEGAEFDKLYDNYKNKGDTADLALGIVAAAWALNLLDATFSGPNLAGLELAAGNSRLEDSHGMQLAFVKRF